MEKGNSENARVYAEVGGSAAVALALMHIMMLLGSSSTVPNPASLAECHPTEKSAHTVSKNGSASRRCLAASTDSRHHAASDHVNEGGSQVHGSSHGLHELDPAQSADGKV